MCFTHQLLRIELVWGSMKFGYRELAEVALLV